MLNDVWFSIIMIIITRKKKSKHFREYFRKYLNVFCFVLLLLLLHTIHLSLFWLYLYNRNRTYVHTPKILIIIFGCIENKNKHTKKPIIIINVSIIYHHQILILFFSQNHNSFFLFPFDISGTLQGKKQKKR